MVHNMQNLCITLRVWLSVNSSCFHPRCMTFSGKLGDAIQKFTVPAGLRTRGQGGGGRDTDANYTQSLTI